MRELPKWRSKWSFSSVWQYHYPMPDIPNMEKYLERGRAVHQWTEQVDEGATVRPPSDYEGYCEAYKKFCHTFAPSWTHIEQPFDNGEWHGFIDLSLIHI